MALFPIFYSLSLCMARSYYVFFFIGVDVSCGLTRSNRRRTRAQTIKQPAKWCEEENSTRTLLFAMVILHMIWYIWSLEQLRDPLAVRIRAWIRCIGIGARTHAFGHLHSAVGFQPFKRAYAYAWFRGASASTTPPKKKPKAIQAKTKPNTQTP